MLSSRINIQRSIQVFHKSCFDFLDSINSDKESSLCCAHETPSVVDAPESVPLPEVVTTEDESTVKEIDEPSKCGDIGCPTDSHRHKEEVLGEDEAGQNAPAPSMIESHRHVYHANPPPCIKTNTCAKTNAPANELKKSTTPCTEKGTISFTSYLPGCNKPEIPTAPKTKPTLPPCIGHSMIFYWFNLSDCDKPEKKKTKLTSPATNPKPPKKCKPKHHVKPTLSMNEQLAYVEVSTPAYPAYPSTAPTYVRRYVIYFSLILLEAWP
jgi:hypothetical protein